MKLRLLALAGLGLLLTGCLGDPPPSMPTSATFNVRLAAPAPEGARLTAAAYLYDQGKLVEVKQVGSGYVAPGSTQGQLYLSSYDLDPLTQDPRCMGPVKSTDPAHPSLDTRDLDQTTLSVTPPDVNTCLLYFLMYKDLNGNGTPEESELLLDTHDQYVYADRDFSYVGQDRTTHTATERGQRARGWTLVRHTVLAPSDAPGSYLVSMNSLPVPATNTYDLFLHEPSGFFTSMSVGGRK